MSFLRVYFPAVLSYDGFITKTHLARLTRLKTEPQGFSLEENGVHYNCAICHASISGSAGWWDLNGEKCLSCQNAVNNGIVPTSICGNRDSWYSTYELTKVYKVTHSTISSMTREGTLKSRKIKAVTGTTTFEIFIKQENEILSTLKKN